MAIVKVESGCFRRVFLFWGLAVKVPQTYSWRNFLTGLLTNMSERRIWRKWPAELRGRLCPVLFSDPLGFVVIMPRLRLLSYEELGHAFPSRKAFYGAVRSEGLAIPVERKADSWGWFKGRVVAIDYHELR